MANNIEWYKEHIDEYLHDTVYDTDSLMIELPEEKWFKINPTRGIRRGQKVYDLEEDNSVLTQILREAYGEIKLDRMSIASKPMLFRRRTVASGGALYPNCLYVVTEREFCRHVYQYNPVYHTLHLLKKEKADNNKSKVFFILTDYYWRNWLKYRFFGYRLMQVDTGYMLCNLSVMLGRRNIAHEIHFSSEEQNMFQYLLDIDLNYEAINAVIEIDEFDECLPVVLDEIDCKIYNDWDSDEIPLYRIIEQKVSDEKIDYKMSLKKKIAVNIDYIRYRISPGGALMQSVGVVDKSELFKVLEETAEVSELYEKKFGDIVLYIYCNKVQGVEKGFYRMELSGDRKLKLYKDVENNIQDILKKKNFNLYEVPAIIFTAGNLEEYGKKYGYTGFKILQTKIGFYSQLLTIVSAERKYYTHPILGYDAELIKKELGCQEDILNMIVWSEGKTEDRLSVDFYNLEKCL